MISHKHKCIIIHIPKNGGTSIEKAIGMSGPRHLIGVNEKQRHNRVWDNYYVFTFVRNPWDRMVSVYHYYQQNTERHNALIRKSIPNNFKKFILKFNQKDKDWYKPFLIPQYDWIHNDKDECLVDFVGRFENYMVDVQKIFSHLKIRPELYQYRKSNHEEYKKYYDIETFNIVRVLFEKDIEYFKYEF